ncbi:MAG: tRNA (guanosine(37)-N1)-methyltransferase TrmD [Parcubacteria group bacterium]
MKFDIITIFPDILDSYVNKGMLRIAQEKKIIKIKTHNLRDFAVDKHGTVDDKPYGGGPGQVLMVEPVFKALKRICIDKARLVSPSSKDKTRLASQSKGSKDATSCVSRPAKKTKIILLSARGKKWTQQLAQSFSKLDRIVFVCPRYEGHDERIQKLVDEEISIGDYVLTGGELGAMVIMDSITRLIPGVLGKKESLKEESHSQVGYLEYPQYTRPEVFHVSHKVKTGHALSHRQAKTRHALSAIKTKKTLLKVPSVLLSGHHKNIADWRAKNVKTLDNK